MQTGGITPLGVFSDAFPGRKVPVHLLTAPGVPVRIHVLAGHNFGDQMGTGVSNMATAFS
jgi:hypothetical protein